MIKGITMNGLHNGYIIYKWNNVTHFFENASLWNTVAYYLTDLTIFLPPE